MPDYPIGVYGAVGGLLFGGGSDERIDPIICGGSTDNGLTTSACYILTNNNNNHFEWDAVANLTEPRSHSSVTSYPVSNSSVPEGLLVTGGRSNRLKYNYETGTWGQSYKVFFTPGAV